MRFQLDYDNFIIQSFDIQFNIIKFNIGVIINKLIIYEYVTYNNDSKKINFDNVEFLKKDIHIIQNKVIDNIEEIIKIININQEKQENKNGRNIKTIR